MRILANPVICVLSRISRTKLRASEPTSASKSVLEHVARRQLYCVDIATSNHCISALSHMQSKSHPADSQPLVIWSSSETKQTSVSTVARLTALLPLELSSFICGYGEYMLANADSILLSVKETMVRYAAVA